MERRRRLSRPPEGRSCPPPSALLNLPILLVSAILLALLYSSPPRPEDSRANEDEERKRRVNSHRTPPPPLQHRSQTRHTRRQRRPRERSDPYKIRKGSGEHSRRKGMNDGWLLKGRKEPASNERPTKGGEGIYVCKKGVWRSRTEFSFGADLSDARTSSTLLVRSSLRSSLREQRGRRKD